MIASPARSNLRGLLSDIKTALSRGGTIDCHKDAELIIEHVTGRSMFDLLIDNHQEMPEEQQKDIFTIVYQRLKKEPLQYITGKAYFMDLEISVNRQVLIPRPETELLVEKVTGLLNNRKKARINRRIVDVGTGSGAIAIALAKRLDPDFEISACDISEEALKVATENAFLNNQSDRIAFLQSDLLENVPAGLNAVIANLPYIPSGELSILQEEVKEEPVLALDGGHDGLRLIESLAQQTISKIDKDGIIALEIGHNQKTKVEEILRTFGCKRVNIYEDYSGVDRIAIGEY